MSESPARTALLDAAEELYARHGLGAVSNRRIVEHAGAANHSAISYHFGGRTGLIEALIARHEREVLRARDAYASDAPATSTHDVLRERIVPLARMLEEMPAPTWRAQFLAQARSDPEALEFLEAASRRSAREVTLTAPAMPKESRAVMRARAGLVANMAISVLAAYEQRANEGGAEGSWLDIAYFLVDAAAGMIDAPITYTGPVPRSAEAPLI